MGVMIIAQLKFTDETRYRRYQERFADVFQGSGGRLRVAEENPVTIEGEWSSDKIVVMEFPSATEAQDFLSSDAYRTISLDREAGAVTASVMVRTLVDG